MEEASDQVIAQRAWQEDVDAARHYMTEHPQPPTTGQATTDKAVKCHSCGLQNNSIPNIRQDPQRGKSSFEKLPPSPERGSNFVAHTRPEDLRTSYDARISQSTDGKNQKEPRKTPDSKKRDFPQALSAEKISEMQQNIHLDTKAYELELELIELELKVQIETYEQLKQKQIQAEKDRDLEASSNLLHQAMPDTQGLIDDVRRSLQKVLLEHLHLTLDLQKKSLKEPKADNAENIRDNRIVILELLVRKRTASTEFESTFKEYRELLRRRKKSTHDFHVQMASDLIYYLRGDDKARLDELKKAIEKEKSTKQSDSKSVKFKVDGEGIDGNGPATGLSPKNEKRETDLGHEEKKKSKENNFDIDSVIVVEDPEHQAINERDNWGPGKKKDREAREAKKSGPTSSGVGYKPPEIEDEVELAWGSFGAKEKPRLGLGAAAVAAAAPNASNKAPKPHRSHRVLNDENYRKRS